MDFNNNANNTLNNSVEDESSIDFNALKSENHVNVVKDSHSPLVEPLNICTTNSAKYSDLNVFSSHLNQSHPLPFMDEIIVDDMDSGFQSRPESVNEAIKKRIYKQALNINQTSLVSPKLQRIHDSVSKVFGLNDPPPGFGLIYPKYYYLEQKKPQPMSPLKVWRGFNGNIYFQPILTHHFNLNPNENTASTGICQHCQDQSRSANSYNNNNLFQQQNYQRETEKHHNNTPCLLAINNTPNTTNRIKSACNNNNNNNNNNSRAASKSGVRKRHTTHFELRPTSENNTSKRSTSPPSLLPVAPQQQQEQQQQLIKDIDEMSNSSSSNNNYNNNNNNYNSANSKQYIKFNSSSKISPTSNIINRNNSNSPSMMAPNNTSVVSNERYNTTTHRFTKTDSNLRPILPNLAAVKKNNVPIRGLAYREAKHRITYPITDYQNDNSISKASSYNGTTVNSASNTNLNNNSNNTNNSKVVHIDSDRKLLPTEQYGYNNSNNNNNSSNYNNLTETSQKPSYKQLLKGIKKGVTINLHKQFLTEGASGRRLDENGSIDNSNLGSSSNALLKPQTNNNNNNNNSITVRSTNMSKTNNFKILKIKGARIQDFYSEDINIKEINFKESNTRINPTKPNRVLKSALAKSNSNDPKNRLLSVSNQSIKSNLSSQSLIALSPYIKRINPTPDIVENY